jgi:hypothetical protein
LPKKGPKPPPNFEEGDQRGPESSTATEPETSEAVTASRALPKKGPKTPPNFEEGDQRGPESSTTTEPASSEAVTASRSLPKMHPEAALLMERLFAMERGIDAKCWLHGHGRQSYCSNCWKSQHGWWWDGR